MLDEKLSPLHGSLVTLPTPLRHLLYLLPTEPLTESLANTSVHGPAGLWTFPTWTSLQGRAWLFLNWDFLKGFFKLPVKARSSVGLEKLPGQQIKNILGSTRPY